MRKLFIVFLFLAAYTSLSAQKVSGTGVISSVQEIGSNTGVYQVAYRGFANVGLLFNSNNLLPGQYMWAESVTDGVCQQYLVQQVANDATGRILTVLNLNGRVGTSGRPANGSGIPVVEYDSRGIPAIPPFGGSGAGFVNARIKACLEEYKDNQLTKGLDSLKIEGPWELDINGSIFTEKEVGIGMDPIPGKEDLQLCGDLGVREIVQYDGEGFDEAVYRSKSYFFNNLSAADTLGLISVRFEESTSPHLSIEIVSDSGSVKHIYGSGQYSELESFGLPAFTPEIQLLDSGVVTIGLSSNNLFGDSAVVHLKALSRTIEPFSLVESNVFTPTVFTKIDNLDIKVRALSKDFSVPVDGLVPGNSSLQSMLSSGRASRLLAGKVELNNDVVLVQSKNVDLDGEPLDTSQVRGSIRFVNDSYATYPVVATVLPEARYLYLPTDSIREGDMIVLRTDQVYEDSPSGNEYKTFTTLVSDVQPGRVSMADASNQQFESDGYNITATFYRPRSLKIRDVDFVGDNAFAVNVQGYSSVTFEGCSFSTKDKEYQASSKKTDGIRAVACYNIRVDDCSFENVHYGVSMRETNHAFILGCRMDKGRHLNNSSAGADNVLMVGCKTTNCFAGFDSHYTSHRTTIISCVSENDSVPSKFRGWSTALVDCSIEKVLLYSQPELYDFPAARRYLSKTISGGIYGDIEVESGEYTSIDGVKVLGAIDLSGSSKSWGQISLTNSAVAWMPNSKALASDKKSQIDAYFLAAERPIDLTIENVFVTGKHDSAQVANRFPVDADEFSHGILLAPPDSSLGTRFSARLENITVSGTTNAITLWGSGETYSQVQVSDMRLINSSTAIGTSTNAGNELHLAAISRIFTQGNFRANPGSAWTNKIKTSKLIDLGSGGSIEHSFFSGTSVPIAGNWLRGQTMLNRIPSSTAPWGWVCTVSGSPGTWVPVGSSSGGGTSGSSWIESSGNVYRATGNVGAGTTTPSERLHVVGNTLLQGRTTLRASQSSIGGDRFLDFYYANGQVINSISTRKSSSALVLGYATAAATNANGLVSTADNSSWRRGALEISNELSFSNLGSTSRTVDSSLSLSRRFFIDRDGETFFDKLSGAGTRAAWLGSDGRLLASTGTGFSVLTNGSISVRGLALADMPGGVYSTNNPPPPSSQPEVDAIWTAARDRMQLDKQDVTIELYTTAQDWAKPSGYSGYVRSTSTSAPAGSGHGYYQIVSKKDISGGYSAFWVDNLTKDLWVGESPSSTTLPSWRKVNYSTPSFSGFSSRNTGASPQAIDPSTYTTVTPSNIESGSSGYSAGIYTAPASGWYDFKGHVSFSTNPNGISTAIFVDGILHTLIGKKSTGGASGGSALIYMTAGQTATLRVRHTATAAANTSSVAGETSFSAHLVR